MRSACTALALALLLGGCTTGSEPASLTGGEKGVFSSRNAGTPIPADRIKGLDETQLAALLGAGVLDRKDEPARALRYQSDACQLFVYLYRRDGTTWRAEYADAYDLHLRPLPVDRCAGSVAAQKRRVA
ncbi:MAG: hypothetical protein AB7F22_19695 [Reyranella sp.]|uniref:hypothetical protein n=1 Tax=Reyranella sp. TaxID=1929291 RepID=UPI003D10EF52